MKFSIVTPTLNQGKYIEKTIKSVLNQDKTDIEYLVIDGGSNDNTLKILKKYKKKLKYISEKDSGQSAAINKGFAKSQGDILAWINSDDEYLPNTFTNVERYFRKHPECVMVYGDYWLKNSNEIVFSKVKEIDFNKNIFLAGVNYICQPTVFFRRSLWEELGDFDENMHFAFDANWWKKVVNSGYRIDHLRQYMAVVRLHSNCKTIKYNENAIIEAKIVFGNNCWKLFYRIIRQIIKLLTRGQMNIIPNNMRREWR